MKRFWLLFALSTFVATTLTLNAIGIEVAIEGPKVAAPGDLVILSAKAPGALNHSWILANSSKTFLPVENGTKAIFASGAAGKYIFVLSASDATSLGSVKHELVIGEPGPEPEPNPPGPTPPPTPLPDGKYKLSKFAFDWVKANQGLKASAVTLGNSYGKVADAIDAGQKGIPDTVLVTDAASKSLSDLAKAVSANQTGNVNALVSNACVLNNGIALGSAINAWKPWSAALEAYLEPFDANQSLKTADDYKAVCSEIKTGLLEAAK